MNLTGKERITAIINHQAVDRIGLYEAFWTETLDRWRNEGHLNKNEMADDHFNFDIGICDSINNIADVEYKNEVIEETEEHKLVRNGNGATLRFWKDKSGTPEHYDYSVKDRKTYEEKVKELIKPGEHRLKLDRYKNDKARHDKKQRYTFTDIGGPFSTSMHLCGTENLLMGMALDPEWIMDMFNDYTEMFIGNLEILFEKAGKPDAIWTSEDLGFKEKTFISPEMYRNMLFPFHKKLYDFIHSHKLKIIFHSCGYIHSLLPMIVDSGIDCLQAMEVKAGNDILKIKAEFGDRIALFGGMDARTLISNDKKEIRKELDYKLKSVMDGSGYILHTDHSVPPQVNYESYKYFLEYGLSLGRY